MGDKMSALRLIPIRPETYPEVLRALNIEYVGWVLGQIETHFGITPEALVGAPVPEYVDRVLDKVCGDPPPDGIFYLLQVDGSWAGMGGVRFLREGVAELKRIYVRPAFRGQKLGEKLLTQLLDDARAFGYHELYLDSAPFMNAAQHVYRKLGFSDCPAYDGVEVPAVMHPVWHFFHREL